MLYQIKRSGVFDQIAGLVIGHMSSMNDNTVPYGKTALEIILEHTKNYDFPMAFNCPVGHEPDNRALKCGGVLSLSVTNESSKLYWN